MKLFRTMYCSRIWLVSMLLFFSIFTVGAQELPLKSVEDSLATLMKKIYSDSPVSVREMANDEFIKLFEATVARVDAFDYSFDSLKYIGKVVSEDKKIKVFSWNFPLSGGYQKYYGFILLKNKKGELRLVELTDNRKVIGNPIKDILSPNSWMGALYYSVIDASYKGQTYYVLLGFDFNNLFTSKKIIDVLRIGERGELTFGSDVFYVGESSLSRIIFEFSARATMMLRYIPESQTIVFDHLSPSRPDYAENFQYYGPDFSYDGFRFEKGKWVYVRNLDLRNPKREPVKPIKSDENFVQPGFIYKSKGGLPMIIKK